MKKDRLFLLLSVAILFNKSVYSQEIGCDSLAGFDEFDFWVGEWEIFDITGATKVGESSIEKMESGCMIMENWVSADKATGTGLNLSLIHI